MYIYTIMHTYSPSQCIMDSLNVWMNVFTCSRRYGDRGTNGGGNGAGYNPNPAYSTNTMYRNSTYPTFASRGQQHQPHAPAANGAGHDYDAYATSQHHAHAQSGHQQQSLHSNEVAHNLYNLNLNRTACYNSTDELKQSPVTSAAAAAAAHHEQYDSFPTSQHQHYQQPHHQHGSAGGGGGGVHASSHRGLPRTGSFESRATNSTSQHGAAVPNDTSYYSQHGSLDRERRQQQLPPDHMIIPELIPSKFGSKRESHSDRRDSPYYNGPGATHGRHADAGAAATYAVGRQQQVPAASSGGGGAVLSHRETG